MPKLIIFWTSILVLTFNFSCQNRQNELDLEQEFCAIICALKEQNSLLVDTIHQKLVFFDEIKYQKQKGIDYLGFEDHKTLCDCIELMLISGQEKIYDGAYNQVYRLSFAQAVISNGLELEVVSYAYLDDKDIFVKDNKVYNKNYLLSKVGDEWKVSEGNFIEPKKK